MVKQSVVHSYTGMLFKNTKKQTSYTCNKFNEFQSH